MIKYGISFLKLNIIIKIQGKAKFMRFEGGGEFAKLDNLQCI